MKRSKLLAALVLLGLAGSVALYFAHHHRVAEVEACAPFLPTGLSLSTKFTVPPCGLNKGKDSVESCLYWYGAYARNGVIYDRWGSPIVFYRFRYEGPPIDRSRPGTDWMKWRDNELASLERHNSVIVFCDIVP
jgi:hypothetical protein